jgi:hypothetical protein
MASASWFIAKVMTSCEGSDPRLLREVGDLAAQQKLIQFGALNYREAAPRLRYNAPYKITKKGNRAWGIYISYFSLICPLKILRLLVHGRWVGSIFSVQHQ